MKKSKKSKRKALKEIHFNTLENLYNRSVSIPLKKNKFVIFSDLHLGNGKRNDDFKKNGLLFETILSEFYLKQDYTLILNGDIEELQRFSLKNIKKRWGHLYALWDSFYAKGHFYKLYGNHDEKYLQDKEEYTYPVHHSLILTYKNKNIFLIHGHQATTYYTKFNWFAGFFLKYGANIMGIKNFSGSFQSKFKNLSEKRIYEYAHYKKIISIMGHTHRPLFESLSKLDSLKFSIEDYCREYLHCDEERKKVIRKEIRTLKKEMVDYVNVKEKYSLLSSLYSTDVILPCLFNSGCGIGKHGITSIELSDDTIYLVHWFNRKVSHKYFEIDGYEPVNLAGTDYYRVILKSDSLDYITTRIALLS
ncbi:MAG: metallophosphoesterase family protein [Spirochaetales bacterium]|nr:metallophosphoesterase family protein [Spirochaetales bacterium]